MTVSENSITAAIPVFNGEDYIGRAIASIQNQVRIGATEILVVDDGSSDRTREIVERLMQEDARIRLVSHPRNRGRAAARNTALNSATGELMAWLDADDEWTSDKLSLQVPLLLSLIRTQPMDKLIAYGSYLTHFNQSEKPKINIARPEFEIADLLRFDGARKKFAYPLTQTFVARTEILRTVEYDEQLNWSEDTDYLLRFFAAGGQLVNASAERPVLTYHRSLQGKAKVMESGVERFFDKHRSTFALNGLSANRQLAERLFTMIANAYLSDGETGAYWRCRFRAVLLAPSVFAPRLAKQTMHSLFKRARR